MFMTTPITSSRVFRSTLTPASDWRQRPTPPAASSLVTRAAVEPERPGLNRPDLQQPGRRPRIFGEACRDLALLGCLDDVQGLAALSNRAAENDEAVIDE